MQFMCTKKDNNRSKILSVVATLAVLRIKEVKKMYSIGRLCVKIVGRDAGLRCVIVDKVDDNTVLIDGETRRRNCNVKHLEPLQETIKLKKGASHKDVASEFKKLGFEARETTPKKSKPRPKKQKKEKIKLTEEELEKAKKEKKAEKKQEKKQETKGKSEEKESKKEDSKKKDDSGKKEDKKANKKTKSDKSSKKSGSKKDSDKKTTKKSSSKSTSKKASSSKSKKKDKK